MTTIHEVKAKEVPALDDELAKDIDEEVETLDELKEKYRKELTAAKEEAYKDAVEGAAIDKAVENAEIVELPEEMIHEEVHRSVNEFLGNLQRQGINPDMYFQITGTTQEDLHKQYEAEAESRTKTNLVIEAVAKSWKDLMLQKKKSKKKLSNWQQTTTWKLHKYKTCFQLIC